MFHITCTYFKHDFIDFPGNDNKLKPGNDLFIYRQRSISKTRFILSSKVRNYAPGGARTIDLRISRMLLISTTPLI